MKIAVWDMLATYIHALQAQKKKKKKIGQWHVIYKLDCENQHSLEWQSKIFCWTISHISIWSMKYY